jgi:hypothetical protein
MNKVFGVGLSRTGTLSLTQALTGLGYRARHFPRDRTTRAEVLGALEAPTAPTAVRLSLLDRVDALTDTPVAALATALDAGYPGSRFVLTLRSQPEWLDSCEQFWASVLDPGRRASPGLPLVRYADALERRLYGRVGFDRVAFAAAYERHTESLRQHFAGTGRLLEMDICAGQGWTELCGFLGCEVPRQPFPHLNSRDRQVPRVVELG